MASLKTNTLYLYCLTASKYLFGLATVPYLTRILGPEVYGNLGFAIAIGAYFNIIIDFGFILSGTRSVAASTKSAKFLSEIFSSILIIKVALFIISGLSLYLLSLFVIEVSNNLFLLTLYLVLSLVSSILPDYIYRGLEEMKMVTFRGVITRAIFTLLTFIFIKDKTQILLIPVFQIIGSVLAFLWITYDLFTKYKVRFVMAEKDIIIKYFRESVPFFLSRISSSIYNISNTVILGLFSPGSVSVGYYSSVEKFKTLVSQGCTPIADSFYPYMIRSRNFHRFFRVTFSLESIIIIFCILIFIFAREICVIAFGKDFESAYILLRWMTPIFAFLLLAYMFGFPALTPLGQQKWANRSVEFGMVNQLVGLLLLIFFDLITAVNLCRLTLLSEFIVLSIRISAFAYWYTKYKKTGVNDYYM